MLSSPLWCDFVTSLFSLLEPTFSLENVKGHMRDVITDCQLLTDGMANTFN